MHEGHHGILDGVEEEHHHEHTHDEVPCCSSCSGGKASPEHSGNPKNLHKTLGVIALSVFLIVVFRLLFS